jgi:hypothetical protein
MLGSVLYVANMFKTKAIQKIIQDNKSDLRKIYKGVCEWTRPKMNLEKWFMYLEACDFRYMPTPSVRRHPPEALQLHACSMFS